MADYLVDLARRGWYRRAVKTLGLPLPMPPSLPRERGPTTARPLAGGRAVLGVGPEAALTAELGAALADAGAEILRDARPERADVAVFDATGMRRPHELALLYRFFHPLMASLGAGGRLLVVTRPADALEAPEAAATMAAVEGFVRSAAKEIGRRGATAHLVAVAPGAEDRLGPLARFLASKRSAFLTGQPWRLDDAVRAPERVPTTRLLEGRLALVTGAARGIGEAIAGRLAEEGATVLCVDRPEDEGPGRAVAERIGGAFLGLDVTSAEAPEVLVREVRRRGGLDVLVHNAGITRDKTLARMRPEQWDQTLAVNLEAPLRLTAALLEAGLEDDARVVALSSVAGLAGNFGQTNYAASKAGLAGWVRAVAPGVAPRGIAVNGVAPGFIETRMTAEIPVVQREAARRLSALGQGGQPEDVADLVAFLASPGAAGLSGRIVRACGGMFVGA